MTFEPRKRVLVTGGTGMIGANLVPRLLANGHKVFMLIRSSASYLRLNPYEDQIRFVFGDMTNLESLKTAVITSRPDVVFHLASTRLNPQSIPTSEHLAVNVMGTENLLVALGKRDQTKLIYTSSIAAYGSGSNILEDQPLNPGTMLGVSKACASILLAAHSKATGSNIIDLRLCTPYGPWENPSRLIPNAILSALEGTDLAMSTGNQERDFIYISDVIDALMLCMHRDTPPGLVLNIGSGVGLQVKAVAQRILQIMGHPGKLRLGALETRSDEIMEMSANISAAKDKLGWIPSVSLDDGLRKSIEWFTKNKDLAVRLP